MKISDFTKPEIDYFVENCNFTDEELTYFLMRARDRSNVFIAMEMNVSEAKVSKLARKVKDKIKRVI